MAAVIAKTLSVSTMTKLCTGLALLGLATGGFISWTIQDIRYGAKLTQKEMEIVKFKADLETEKASHLDNVIKNSAIAERRYVSQFGALQKAVQDAKATSVITGEPRELTSDELCILEQAERIAKGDSLSNSCGKTSAAVSTGKYDQN